LYEKFQNNFFLISGLFSLTTWAHAELHWKYPLHIQCEQTDNKQNTWTNRHLFSFEQAGNPNFETDDDWNKGLIVGTYKGHTYAIPPGEVKEFRANEVSGKASFSVSNIENLFEISAIGFMAPEFDDNSGIPATVIGGIVQTGKGAKESSINAMIKSGSFAHLSYNAKCRQITATEALKF